MHVIQMMVISMHSNAIVINYDDYSVNHVLKLKAILVPDQLSLIVLHG